MHRMSPHARSSVYRGHLANIYLVVGLSTLLLAGSFYLFGMRPLIDYLRETHAASIELALQNSVGRLRGIIRNHEDLARQAASRTAIRLKQAAYLRGEVSREALVAFSQPKLADALQANTEILAIARYAPDGDRLFAVGEAVDPALAEQCDPIRLAAVRLLPITGRARPGQLVYCSPIVARDDTRLGMDLLLMSDRSLQRFVNEQSQPPNTVALVFADREIGYWPNAAAPPQARQALTRYLAEGRTDADVIIAQQALGVSDWSLVALVDAKTFFAPIDRQSVVLTVTTLVSMLVVYGLTVMALRPIMAMFVREKRLLLLARTDGLTGLYNHAYMQEQLAFELGRAVRYQRPLTLLLFDIDHFKSVNDRYGHQAGDQVLVALAALCRQLVRETDQLARYGGEEFLIVLPETQPSAGAAFAERLRTTIEQTPFTVAGMHLHLTVSIGLASWDGQAPAPTSEALIRRADRALYRSKGAGRNRIMA